MMTACKKEEMKKESFLIKQNVIVYGYIWDVYKYKNGNIEYIVKSELKEDPKPLLDKDFKFASLPLEENKCEGPGNECFIATIDGKRVIIRRDDAK
jgi:hypothetical protein